MNDKLFSVASWNVEHFRGEPERVERVIGFLKGADGGPPEVPDIFALFEVEGRQVYRPFMEAFPQHRFHLTEGKQTQEIFVGVHTRLQSFVTQRLEFKTGREYQRPGLFVTIRIDGVDYSLLFMHLRSGTTPEDFGLRDAAVERAFNLKKALDRAQSSPANFIFLGDLNTMGIDDTAPYSKLLDLSPTGEISRLTTWAERRGMALLPKTHDVTWWNGSASYRSTALDHVIASTALDIRQADGESPGVEVKGWPEQSGDTAISEWLSTHSDHALLAFIVCS